MRCYFRGVKRVLMIIGNKVTTVFFNKEEIG